MMNEFAKHGVLGCPDMVSIKPGSISFRERCLGRRLEGTALLLIILLPWSRFLVYILYSS